MLSLKPDWSTLLAPHLPEGSGPTVAALIGDTPVRIRVAKPRATKLGDYRPPHRSQWHRISVNGDLNPYAFLVTLIHEIAHLRVYEAYGRRAKPHGEEWKQSFRDLMIEVNKAVSLPSEVDQALQAYLQNPKASSCVDAGLVKALRGHDEDDGFMLLEELPPQAQFQTRNGRIFTLGERVRKRYRCTEIKSGKLYLVHPLAEVRHLPKSSQNETLAPH